MSVFLHLLNNHSKCTIKVLITWKVTNVCWTGCFSQKSEIDWFYILYQSVLYIYFWVVKQIIWVTIISYREVHFDIFYYGLQPCLQDELSLQSNVPLCDHFGYVFSIRMVVFDITPPMFVAVVVLCFCHRCRRFNRPSKLFMSLVVGQEMGKPFCCFTATETAS